MPILAFTLTIIAVTFVLTLNLLYILDVRQARKASVTRVQEANH